MISAPSGAGKTSVVNQTLKELQPIISLQRVITYTTRNPRNTENNKDYIFISQKEFKQKIEENFFLEWTITYGNYYGSPRYILNELDKQSFILVLDREGAKALINKKLQIISIWIQVPHLKILESRLNVRGTESSAEIQKRLTSAKKELQEESDNPIFRYYLNNKVFKETVSNLKTLILDEIYRQKQS